MKKFPQFLSWAIVLDFELVCLQLVRAIREADFSQRYQRVTSINVFSGQPQLCKMVICSLQGHV